MVAATADSSFRASRVLGMTTFDYGAKEMTNFDYGVKAYFRFWLPQISVRCEEKSKPPLLAKPARNGAPIVDCGGCHSRFFVPRFARARNDRL
jgi:hypothetical protein